MSAKLNFKRVKFNIEDFVTIPHSLQNDGNVSEYFWSYCEVLYEDDQTKVGARELILLSEPTYTTDYLDFKHLGLGDY